MSDSMFRVVKAWEMVPERDVLVAFPKEFTTPHLYHRVPVRSSAGYGSDGRPSRVQFMEGQSHMVQSPNGLKRLLMEFPRAWTPGLRSYQNIEGTQPSMSMGFALYDPKMGPTHEEQESMNRIDQLAHFIKRTMLRCEKARKLLKLGNAVMDDKQQELAAEMLDMCIARPATIGNDGQTRRYCYPKVVLPGPNVPESFHTWFWTPNGEPIPLTTLHKYQNFFIVPFVEVDEVFVNKGIRSIQLRMRECIVYPPTERSLTRTSVCFPGRIIKMNEDGTDMVSVNLEIGSTDNNTRANHAASPSPFGASESPQPQQSKRSDLSSHFIEDEEEDDPCLFTASSPMKNTRKACDDDVANNLQMDDAEMDEPKQKKTKTE